MTVMLMNTLGEILPSILIFLHVPWIWHVSRSLFSLPLLKCSSYLSNQEISICPLKPNVNVLSPIAILKLFVPTVLCYHVCAPIIFLNNLAEHSIGSYSNAYLSKVWAPERKVSCHLYFLRAQNCIWHASGILKCLYSNKLIVTQVRCMTHLHKLIWR